MARLLDENVATVAIGGLMVGLGLVFLVIQERTKATVGLAVIFVSAGLDLLTIPLVLDRVDPDAIRTWERLQVLSDAGFVAGFAIYIAGLLVTTQSSERAERFIRG